MNPTGKGRYFAIVAIVALLDQLTKAWVRRNLVIPGTDIGTDPIPLWVNHATGQIWFELQYATNTGAAWGIFEKQTSSLAALSAVMILVIGWVLLTAKKEERLLSVALSLMLGGAFGNLLDRVIHGKVTDFFHAFLPLGGITQWLADVTKSPAIQYQVDVNMPSGIYDFPIFNVADSAVVVGTVLLLIALMRPAPHPQVAPALIAATADPEPPEFEAFHGSEAGPVDYTAEYEPDDAEAEVPEASATPPDPSTNGTHSEYALIDLPPLTDSAGSDD